MRRRHFIGGVLGATAAWPLAGAAEQAKVPRIGVLFLGDREPFWSVFRDGLRELGYVEGRNIRFELRSAQGKASLLPDLATELVRLNVDIIVAFQTPAAQAAKQATREIPIVISAGDPVETGLVASLARPGGNVTGVTGATAEIAGKSLELIRALLPSASRVAVLAHDSNNPFTKLFLEQIGLAARTIGVAIQSIMISGAEEFDAAFSQMVRERVDAVIVQPIFARQRVADLALKHRLPAVSPTRAFAEAGGLISYSANLRDMYRKAAVYVDKILNGQKPADLPVEAPTKFELVINLKTAKALGLTIPPTLLARADEVIE